MNRQYLPNRGFTILELMFAVTILGILAAIAVPNYRHFLARSRSTEGRVMIATAYSSMKKFYIQYSTYTSCMKNTGYVPEGFYLSDGRTPNPNYDSVFAIGFSDAIAGLGRCGANGTTSCSNMPGITRCTVGDGNTSFRGTVAYKGIPARQADLQSWVKTNDFALQAVGATGLSASNNFDGIFLPSAYADEDSSPFTSLTIDSNKNFKEVRMKEK